MSLGAHGVTFVLDAVPPDAGTRPLWLELQIVHTNQGVLAHRVFTISEPGAHRLGVSLPPNILVDDNEYLAVVKLQRCFTPRNMGINGDDRRLGIRIRSVQFD